MAKTKTIQQTVGSPCSAYLDMAAKWPLIDDLIAGSDAMRANCAAYLPKFSKEDSTHYQARVTNSILFSAYGDTVKTICSKPFSKPITIQGDLPETIAKIEDDTDGQGKSLNQLAKDLLNDFVNRGLGHVLVDYPVTISEEGKTPNMKQERDKGYKPMLIHIKPENLIGWRIEKNAAGLPELSRIRIKETRIEPSGEWGEEQSEYIRVISKVNWQLYKKITTGKTVEYNLESEGINSLGKVPLLTGYANMTGFMTAEPPLKELAEVNLAHYRSDSDQQNLLHYARVATLVVLGFGSDEAEKIALGPNQLICSNNADAKVTYVEHSGKAIEAGAKDLDKKEERMMILGLQPFIQRKGNQTATGQSLDESRANSDIQAWVMSLEDLLYRAYMMAAEWISIVMPVNFKIDVFNDFAVLLRAMEDIANLIKMRQASELSRVTFLREIKKRGLLSETVDIDVEVAAIEAEGPALAMLGGGEE